MSPRSSTPSSDNTTPSRSSQSTGESPDTSSEDLITREHIQVAPESIHAFRPPERSASRAPCPALNTLANHGYLPRDGRNIAASDLFKALRHPETYNVSVGLASVLAYDGLAMMHKVPPSHISLYDLARHGRIEHDASLVHKNTKEGQEFAPVECDTQLLEELLGGREYLTMEAVAEKRVVLERAQTIPVGGLHRAIARGEWALVLDIFGREHGGQVPAKDLRVWLKENRFPEDWKPKHEQGLKRTREVAHALHEKMKEYQKEQDSAETSDYDTDEEWELALKLGKTAPDSATVSVGEVRGRDSYSPSPGPRPLKRQKTLAEDAL